MNFWFLGVPVRAVEPRNPKMGWLISNRLRGNISVETTGYFSGNQWFPMVCAHFSATHADNQRFLDVLSTKSCVSCVDRLWKNTRRCSCRAYVPTLGSTTVLPHQNHLTILTFVHPHGILIDRCFFHTHMYIYIAPFKTRLMESPYPHGYPPKSPAGTCSTEAPDSFCARRFFASWLAWPWYDGDGRWSQLTLELEIRAIGKHRHFEIIAVRNYSHEKQIYIYYSH